MIVVINRFYKVLFLIIFITGCSSPDDFLPKEKLKNDFKIFEEALKQSHAGLYRYTDEIELNTFIDSIRSKISDSLTIYDFYKLISATCSKIKCWHSRVILSKDSYNSFINHYNFLPFDLYITNKKGYLQRDYSNDQKIPIGSEILAINGSSFENIFQRMLKYINKDGYNITFPQKKLSTKFGFWTHYSLYIDDNSDFFQIDYLYKNEKKQITIPAQSWKSIKNYDNKRYSIQINKVRKTNELIVINDSTAILTIVKFSDINKKFNDFIEESFLEIQRKSITKLIIDLRENGGGNDYYGSKLLTYFIKQPTAYTKSLTYKLEGTDFLKNTILNNTIEAKNEDDYAMKFKNMVVDEAKNNLNLNLIQPDRFYFSDNLIVLITGETASTSSEFVTILKQNRAQSTIIGEESGGVTNGVNGGILSKLILPNSKIEIHIPHILYRNATTNLFPRGYGLSPDIYSMPKVTDLINGIDVTMNLAISLLEN